RRGVVLRPGAVLVGPRGRPPRRRRPGAPGRDRPAVRPGRGPGRRLTRPYAFPTAPLRGGAMPKVSVIIPSYNHGRFLARRFDSVLAQTYRDFEILFLDDASTDDSLQVFAKYSGHPLIRAFNNDRNSGSTFKQWNRGVRDAHGEYIWLAESDDA